MGQVFCRSRRDRSAIDEEYQERMIETNVYLPGSLDYLELIGMDRCGHFIPEEERL